jgi:hypothetical protein
MGFDLNGLKPSNQKGEYFRNNAWWWRPLAEYVLEVCGDLFEVGENEYWSTNDGQAVSVNTSVKIAERLFSLIKSGKTKKYEEQYEDYRKSIPKIKCKWCNGTGDRKDLEPSEWKKKCGGCNACHGTGKVEQSEAMYLFSEGNVKEFAGFCEASGGFEIW